VSKQFGEYLRKLRKQRNLSLREVEKKAGISNAYLSQIERGERGAPSIEIMNRLAETYGVPVVDLIRVALPKEKDYFTTLVPDTKYVYTGYEELSVENKILLVNYLQYLREKNKRESKNKEQDE
jgi:transcriptional regulator with XRE-family HTH domain